MKISDAAARQYADALKLPDKNEDGAGWKRQGSCDVLRERLLEVCRQMPDYMLASAMALIETLKNVD